LLPPTLDTPSPKQARKSDVRRLCAGDQPKRARPCDWPAWRFARDQLRLLTTPIPSRIMSRRPRRTHQVARTQPLRPRPSQPRSRVTGAR